MKYVLLNPKTKRLFEYENTEKKMKMSSLIMLILCELLSFLYLNKKININKRSTGKFEWMGSGNFQVE